MKEIRDSDQIDEATLPFPHCDPFALDSDSNRMEEDDLKSASRYSFGRMRNCSDYRED